MAEAQKWKAIAEELVKEFPLEIMKEMIANETIVLNIIPPARKGGQMAMLTAERTRQIEQMAIDVTNRYYTSCIREQLKKLIP